jgi:hypothetical protein
MTALMPTFFLATIADRPFLALGLCALSVAVFGIVHDRRHARRRDLDRVSLVSWGQLSILALIVAIACLSIGLRTGQ